MVNLKTCTYCNIKKDISCFCIHSKSPDGYTYWCDECRRAYRRKRYCENIEENRAEARANRAEQVKLFQDKYKLNIPCKDCGKVFEPYCMDFDHISERGKKFKNVSRMVLEGYSDNLILEEINKCDLVCVLCHNERTYKRNGDGKYKPCVLRNIKVIRKFKANPCAICGNQYEHYNMQADHINHETKLYPICSLKRCKLQTLLDELEKCQVLCALCHRRKSILEQKEGKYLIPKSQQPEPKRKKLFYDPETNMKECATCHQIKHTSIFLDNDRLKSGIGSWCIECAKEYHRKRRELFKQQAEQIKQQNKIQSDINK
jgi:hypothetical protein